MWDIIWPWGALREARRTIARRDREIRGLDEAVSRNIVQMVRQAQLLDEAYFKNPKTGRIGKKGQRFDKPSE